MAYEDPNAPSPTSSNVASKPAAPVDQSKTFLGGQHHPWRRLFARTVDICRAGFVLFMLLIFAFSATMSEQAEDFAKAIENPIIASVALYLAGCPPRHCCCRCSGRLRPSWALQIAKALPS